MLKKVYRLKGDDIKEFFKNRDFSKKENFNFLILFKKNHLNHPRFAVKPLVKIFKKAVERNRIKRRIYSIIENEIKSGFNINKDFIIFVKNKEILTKNYNDLKKELMELIKNV